MGYFTLHRILAVVNIAVLLVLFADGFLLPMTRVQEVYTDDIPSTPTEDYTVGAIQPTLLRPSPVMNFRSRPTGNTTYWSYPSFSCCPGRSSGTKTSTSDSFKVLPLALRGVWEG